MTVTLPVRRRHRMSPSVAALVACALLLAGALQISAAAAQDEAPVAAPQLMLIDTSDEPYALVRTATEPSRVEVTVGNTPADIGTPVPLADSGLPIRTTIVIDNSAAAREHLESFLAATETYINGAGPEEQIAVWTSGGVSRLRAGFSAEHERTRAVASGIVTAAGDSMIYDTVRDAALELGGSQAGATNVVVFAGAIDGGSLAAAGSARGAVQSADASAFAVAASDAVAGAMQTLAASTFDGRFLHSDVPGEIAAFGGTVSEVVNSAWMIPFRSDVIADGNQLTITVDGTAIRASYAPGSSSAGRVLAPFTELGDGGLPGLGFLAGDTGRLLGLTLGALAAGLGAYAVVLLVQKDESSLNSVLQAYNDPLSKAAIVEEEGSSLSRSALLKRAVEVTEGFAERRGVLSRLEGLLERADLPLRAGEALTAAAGIALAVAAIGYILTGSLIGLVIFTALGAIVPSSIVRFKAARRRKAFMGQLPDTLQLLSSTLKAGFSFMQGVEAVSKEVEEPMGGELRRIVTEAQLGRPLEDAMDASADRMGSPDFAWAVMAVKIQREVGGNLSELLLTVAETMTERERLRRDVATLTAEGKMSAIVLGALPILLGMAMWAINPEYIDTLFTDGFGKVLLGMSIFAAAAGFAWMKKIITIDI